MRLNLFDFFLLTLLHVIAVYYIFYSPLFEVLLSAVQWLLHY